MLSFSHIDVRAAGRHDKLEDIDCHVGKYVKEMTAGQHNEEVQNESHTKSGRALSISQKMDGK